MGFKMKQRLWGALCVLIACCLIFLVGCLMVTDSTQKAWRVTTADPHCVRCWQWSYHPVINLQDICLTDGKHCIDLIFLIPSSQDRRARRDAIRQTWASITRNNTSNFRHVFLFGETNDPKRMRVLEEESRQFRDVVIMRFQDSYRNLTVKTLTSLRWLTENCPQARFFLKVDDDMWVNSRVLLDRLTTVEKHLQTAIAGRCNMSPKVIRDTENKWSATYAEYPANSYPKYCSGTAYAGTVNVARQLISVSSNVPFFHLEDVFIGLCLKHLGYSVRYLEGFHMNHPAILRKDQCAVWKPQIITVHRVPPDTLFSFWRRKCGDKTKLLPPVVNVL